ncbi:hypothetical protein JCM3766R1_002274 [Sporobolomyces carnicolor]
MIVAQPEALKGKGRDGGLNKRLWTRSEAREKRSIEMSDRASTSLSAQGLVVSILINDAAVEMHKPELSDSTATCYIESAQGQSFAVDCRMTLPFSPMSINFRVSVDGSPVHSGALIRHPGQSNICNGTYTGPTTKQALVFAKVNLTDDAESACQDESFIKKLGTIEVKCYRVYEIGLGAPCDSDASDGFSSDRAVDERSKKASVSHQVTLGQALVVPARTGVNVSYVDSLSNPYATFEIKYRSRALLEVLDIVKPLVPAEVDAAPAVGTSTSTAKETKPAGKLANDKKRKAAFTIDKDGALVISDDSDDDEEIEVVVKKEGKKVKKESDVQKEKERVCLEVD